MQDLKKTSSILIALIFLLPIFFVPWGVINLGDAKSILIVLGLIVLVMVFLKEAWQDKRINMPWHPIMLATLLLPVIYLFSAVFSSPSSLSIFGYNFEVGTFGSILLLSILLVVSAVALNNSEKMMKASIAVFASLSLILVFAVIKIFAQAFFSSNFPVWGLFFGAGDTPLGRWTDLAVILGLLACVSVIALGIIPMKKSFRLLTHGIFIVAVIVLAVLNFSTAFFIILVSSVVIAVYLLTVEKHFLSTDPAAPDVVRGVQSKSVLLPIILVIVSLVFIINPVLSQERGSVGDIISSATKIVTADVKPSFSTTLSISRSALSRDVLLGSGPNTFDRDWLIYKPVGVNTTPFWGVAFSFGSGFIPTQAASTGALGIALWLLFLGLLFVLGFRALRRMPESRANRFLITSSLFASLYLWIAAFMYAPSIPVLALTFFFTGLFLAAVCRAEIIPTKTIELSQDVSSSFVSILMVTMVILGMLVVGFVSVNRTLAAFYFKKAVNLSQDPTATFEPIEAALSRAIKFAPLDIYWATLSRVYFAKAQVAAVNTEGSPEDNLAVFEESVARSIESARVAVQTNPNSYGNWIILGNIYSALVPPPLSVEGAYESARFAYREARARSPLSPEVPLLEAGLEISRGDLASARSLVRESVTLKEDYVDAYLALVQLEMLDNNLTNAIASAERIAALLPGNPGLYFELGLLKYSNRDYRGALEALQAALTIVPDYANAQYYLGLSFARLNMLDEAREQFEALSLTNPDNEEVRMILESLRSGENIF